MRVTLWLLGLFAVAVAVALAAGNNQGTVTLFWPPWRVDLSLNLVVLGLALLFFAMHVALRALSALIGLPLDARRWRAQQRERAAHVALLDAASHLLAGRFLRARRAAQACLARLDAMHDGGDGLSHAHQLRTMAHLLSAESAHALQDRAERDRHLQLALDETGSRSGASAQEMSEGVHLRAARWSLDDRDGTGTLNWLSGLPQGAARRTLALRLRLKAARLAGRIPDALETARLLAKHKAFTASASQVIVRGLLLERMGAAHDGAQLQRIWAELDESERAMPEVAVLAARRLAEFGGDPVLGGPWLLPVWQAFVDNPATLPVVQRGRLIGAVEDLLGTEDDVAAREWLGRIETAQQRHPRQPDLLYLAGMACLKRQLWGKAQQLLSQAAPALGRGRLARGAWSALARLAENRGDAEAAAAAWKQAALAAD